MCIFANIPMYEIAQWLGHRDSRTTGLVYAHITRGAYKRGGDRIADRLIGEIEPIHGLISPRRLAVTDGGPGVFGDLVEDTAERTV